MIQRSRALHGAPRLSWRALSPFTLVVLLLSNDAKAHDVFKAYVQHKIRLTLGPKHIEIMADLTFFEDWSARERAGMDTDGNGRITRTELEARLKQLAPQLKSQVRLRIAGRELDLTPLYEPELDLLAKDEVGPAHHRVRLWLFAPTPATLRPGDEIIIEDSLWPQAKALGTLDVKGRDGFVLKVQTAKGPLFPPARPGESRVFKTRCVEIPANKLGS